jgi:protein-S-isoprenylcysteine O-methyltransferase Ste14
MLLKAQRISTQNIYFQKLSLYKTYASPVEKRDIFLNKCKHWFRELPPFSFQLKNEINNISEGAKVGMNTLQTSLKNGDKGKRGEEFVAIQFILAIFLLFGVPSFIKFLIVFSSFFSYVTGFLIFLSSVWTARNYLSVFVTPNTNHKLLDTGPYAFLRHPMYFGLTLMNIGSSVLSRDVYKLIISLTLLIVFDNCATQEETILRRIYPSDYSNYAEDKYKIIPLLY